MKRINIKTYIANMYIPIGSYISIRKALMQAGIVTVADLCKKTEEELSRELASRQRYSGGERFADRNEPK